MFSLVDVSSPLLRAPALGRRYRSSLASIGLTSSCSSARLLQRQPRKAPPTISGNDHARHAFTVGGATSWPSHHQPRRRPTSMESIATGGQGSTPPTANMIRGRKLSMRERNRSVGLRETSRTRMRAGKSHQAFPRWLMQDGTTPKNKTSRPSDPGRNGVAGGAVIPVGSATISILQRVRDLLRRAPIR